MVSPRRLATLLTALALAATPASALAQGAGDDQYEDPFGDEVPQSATATPSPTGEAAQDEDETPAPVTDEIPGSGEPEPEDEAADDQTPDEDAPAAQRSQLPATGSDALLLGMLGLAMVSGGAGLRLRLRDGAPPA